jgi:hypothetical protein
MFSTYYLNQRGTKWVHRTDDKNTSTIRLICKKDHYDKIRKIEYYESFGNFAAIVLKYKGKRISVLPEGDQKTGELIAYVDYKEKYQ